jgi:hypothetical protein
VLIYSVDAVWALRLRFSMDLCQILPNSVVLDDPDNSVNHKLVRVDPLDCERILKYHNANNRPIRRHTVARFVEDMKHNRFDGTTHQGIAFDVNGHLLDGQHRFTSIAQSKQPQVVRVWTNRDPKQFAVIDAGVARTASDNLHYSGVSRPKIVAPGIKHVILYKKHPNRVWSCIEMPSSVAIEEFYNANKFTVDTIAEVVHSASIGYRPLNRTGLFVLCFLALESGYKTTDIIAFCHNLAKGAGLSEENAIHAYRNFLVNHTSRSSTERNLQQFSTACLIKVWNYAQSGLTLRQFKPPSYPSMPTVELPVMPNRTKLPKNLRYSILLRDNFACQACGAKASDGADLEADHVIPRSKGGSNEPSNLMTLCSNCNGGKSDKLDQDFIF